MDTKTTWKVSVIQLQVFLSTKSIRPSPPAASSVWYVLYASAWHCVKSLSAWLQSREGYFSLRAKAPGQAFLSQFGLAASILTSSFLVFLSRVPSRAGQVEVKSARQLAKEVTKSQALEHPKPENLARARPRRSQPPEFRSKEVGRP